MSRLRIQTQAQRRVNREHSLAWRAGLWRPSIITPKVKPKPQEPKPTDGR